jgi:hypothetical protein
MLWLTIIKDVVLAIVTGEIKHWWLCWQAHKAIQGKMDDRNIQNDAFNSAPGASNNWLHEHKPESD